MKVSFKSFSELSTIELFKIYELRARVFVVEQNCAYQDIDDLDLQAKHVLLEKDGVLNAYARIIAPSELHPEPRIGRVVVRAEERGKALGKLLMKHCMSKCSQEFENKQIVISAQSYLLRFYSELGFMVEGPEYLEDDIPHCKMRFTAA